MKELITILMTFLFLGADSQNTNSLRFNGSKDKVIVNHSSSIDVSNSITIGFWMKPYTWNIGEDGGLVSKK